MEKLLFLLIFYVFFYFQNLKNQIMTTNVWVEQVSLSIYLLYMHFFQFAVTKLSSQYHSNFEEVEANNLRNRLMWLPFNICFFWFQFAAVYEIFFNRILRPVWAILPIRLKNDLTTFSSLFLGSLSIVYEFALWEKFFNLVIISQFNVVEREKRFIKFAVILK